MRNYISLFSGAMGLDLGLEQAGFIPSVCNEIDSSCVNTIRHNRPCLPVIFDSIENISGERLSTEANKALNGIDLIAGGPPCQAFSVYGNRRGVEDGRGRLVFEFVRIVKELRPKTFIMENVRGLHSMPFVPKTKGSTSTDTRKLLDVLINDFEGLGYRVDCFLVNVVNYGGPQIRERIICIGNRYNLCANFPLPLYSNRDEDNLPPFRTLRDAIGENFVDPDPTLLNFSKRKLHYLSLVPPGGNWRSLPVDLQKESMGKSWYLKGGRSATWRKLSWDFPSPTVVTLPNHASTSMCHPTELRALTVGECAAIQEFPNDWIFVGKAMEKYRQVGNAVPTRLGRVAGEAVADLLEKIDSIGEDQKPESLLPSTVQHIRPHVRTKTYWKNGKAFAGDVCYYSDCGETEDDDQLNLPEI